MPRQRDAARKTKASGTNVDQAAVSGVVRAENGTLVVDAKQPTWCAADGSCGREDDARCNDGCTTTSAYACMKWTDRTSGAKQTGCWSTIEACLAKQQTTDADSLCVVHRVPADGRNGATVVVDQIRALAATTFLTNPRADGDEFVVADVSKSIVCDGGEKCTYNGWEPTSGVWPALSAFCYGSFTLNCFTTFEGCLNAAVAFSKTSRLSFDCTRIDYKPTAEAVAAAAKPSPDAAEVDNGSANDCPPDKFPCLKTVEPFTEFACGKEWGFKVDHTCDPGCSNNPDHSFVGCETSAKNKDGSVFRCGASRRLDGQSGCCVQDDDAATIDSATVKPARDRWVYFVPCKENV